MPSSIVETRFLFRKRFVDRRPGRANLFRSHDVRHEAIDCRLDSTLVLHTPGCLAVYAYSMLPHIDTFFFFFSFLFLFFIFLSFPLSPSRGTQDTYISRKRKHKNPINMNAAILVTAVLGLVSHAMAAGTCTNGLWYCGNELIARD